MSDVVKRGPGRPKKVVPEAVQAYAEQVVEAYAEAKDAEDVPVRESVVVAPPARPCALEDAPIGSKLVVSRDAEKGKVARLITPTESIELPREDVAYTLPVGAKIRRKMASVFEASQLNADYRTMTTATARAAVEQFREYFNPQD